MSALAATTGLGTGTTADAGAAPLPVRAVKLGKWIDQRAILRDLELQVPAGRYVALLGANGAGKSTLLKILATLAPATHGTLELFGQPLTRDGTARLRSRIGLIGHQSMLYHDLSARENLVFFGRLYGVKDVGQRADEMLARLGLSARAHDPVKAFSRGMTQRVAIARALMHNPELLLADEPFAGLDAPSIAAVERILAELHATGKTIILANHDIPQTLRLVQHVVVLRGGRKVIDKAASELESSQVLAEMAKP